MAKAAGSSGQVTDRGRKGFGSSFPSVHTGWKRPVHIPSSHPAATRPGSRPPASFCQEPWEQEEALGQVTEKSQPVQWVWCWSWCSGPGPRSPDVTASLYPLSPCCSLSRPQFPHLKKQVTSTSPSQCEYLNLLCEKQK
jgi:hypothetical protein